MAVVCTTPGGKQSNVVWAEFHEVCSSTEAGTEWEAFCVIYKGDKEIGRVDECSSTLKISEDFSMEEVKVEGQEWPDFRYRDLYLTIPDVLKIAEILHMWHAEEDKAYWVRVEKP